ncbi:MAG: hypothetical protein RR459_07660 [Christensenellaceae bacterium]
MDGNTKGLPPEITDWLSEQRDKYIIIDEKVRKRFTTIELEKIMKLEKQYSVVEIDKFIDTQHMAEVYDGDYEEESYKYYKTLLKLPIK